MARRIKTTETSFEIVELLKQLEGATMSELSDRLDLANSTIHGHLKTLEKNRLVVKEGNEYHVGLRFFHYGEYTRWRKPEYRYVPEKIEELVELTQEGSNFAVEEHGQMIVLFGDSTPEDPIYDTGKFFHMHDNASGKAILAEMTDERVTEVLDRWGLPATTEHTITDRDALFDELETIRDRGYAFNREELLTGLNAVATVVQRPDSSILGALSVGGPSYRIRGPRLEEELPEVLLQTNAELEAEIRAIYLER